MSEEQRETEITETTEGWDEATVEAWEAYRKNVGDKYATVEDFEEAYRGEWDSVADCAQQLAEDCGMIPADMTWPLYCIDWEWAARELVIGGDIWTHERGYKSVFVFDNI